MSLSLLLVSRSAVQDTEPVPSWPSVLVIFATVIFQSGSVPVIWVTPDGIDNVAVEAPDGTVIAHAQKGGQVSPFVGLIICPHHCPSQHDGQAQ